MLRSYSFEKKFDERCWLLFSEDIGGTDCTLEVIDAAMRGRINLDKVESAVENGNLKNVFNLEAYNNTVKKNQGLVAYKRSSKTLHISDGDGDESIEPYGVSEAVASGYINQPDEYAKIDDTEEFEYALNRLGEMYWEILAEYKADVIYCMYMYLKGNRATLNTILRVIEEAPKVAELIYIILSSGEEIAPLLHRQLENRGVRLCL